MPLLNGCCCFESLYTGSKVSAIFTFATGVLNLVINIWLLVGIHDLHKDLEDHEKWVLLPPGILVFLYIELACNLSLLVFSFVLWIGVNQRYEGRNLVRAWTVGVVCLRGYEIFLGIYVLGWLGGHRIEDILYVVPEFIVVIFYWCLDTIFLVACILCVISYRQEMLDEVYGKEKRARYFNMLANIRHASGRAGTATPGHRSYYSSRLTLAMSHASLQGSHHPSQSHPSVSSYPQGPQHQSVSSYPQQHPSVGSYHHQQQLQPHHGYPQHPSVSSYGHPAAYPQQHKY